MRVLSPFIPFETFSLAASTTGSPPRQYKMDALRASNQRDEWIWVDEIRFGSSTAVYCDDVNVLTPGSQFQILAHIEVQIHAGATPITDGFISVWQLGGQFNRDMSHGSGSFGDTSTQQVWRFNEPLLLKPREVLTFEFRLAANWETQLVNGTTNPDPTTPVEITVALASRIADPNELTKKRCFMPWVTNWTSSLFAPGTYTDEQSPDNAFVNPFDQPLRVLQLTGRLMWWYADAYDTSSVDPKLWHETLILKAKPSFLQNAHIIKDWTPFGAVFSQADNSWFTNSLVPPRSFYKWSLRGDFRNYTATNFADSQAYIQIAMLGQREIAIPPVYLNAK